MWIPAISQLNGCVSNKLHSFKPLLGYSNLSSLSRQDAVVLRRIRIGHTRLTHSYLLNWQYQPECSHCDCSVLTVAHVLLECNHYNHIKDTSTRHSDISLTQFFQLYKFPVFIDAHPDNQRPSNCKQPACMKPEDWVTRTDSALCHLCVLPSTTPL